MVQTHPNIRITQNNVKHLSARLNKVYSRALKIHFMSDNIHNPTYSKVKLDHQFLYVTSLLAPIGIILDEIDEDLTRIEKSMEKYGGSKE